VHLIVLHLGQAVHVDEPGTWGQQRGVEGVGKHGQ
jgi:hypothetical protein